MFKEKKSEENHLPLYDNSIKLQDENYMKNNYFSRTVEENDSMKKEVCSLTKLHFLIILAIKIKKARDIPQENYDRNGRKA
jgi:hypothetical protein